MFNGVLNLQAPIPQHGQIHSNNSYCLSVFDHFVGLALKGLNTPSQFCIAEVIIYGSFLGVSALFLLNTFYTSEFMQFLKFARM